MVDELKDEIDEMNKGLSGQLGEEDPIVEPIVEPVIKPVVEPVIEPVVEPVIEPVVEPVVEPIVEPVVPDARDQAIADLRKEIEDLKGKKVEPPVVEKPVVEEPLTLEEQDFIGDLDLDEVVRDKEAFNKLLNTIYTKGIGESRKLTSEKVLLAIPDIVKHNITLLTALKETSEQFYKDNPDLAPFKKVVATVFEEVAAENPGKNFRELITNVGVEARKRLDLHKKAVEPIDDKNKNKDGSPRLPQKKGGPKDIIEKPNTSPLQDEIEAMNKTLGG